MIDASGEFSKLPVQKDTRQKIDSTTEKEGNAVGKLFSLLAGEKKISEESSAGKLRDQIVAKAGSLVAGAAAAVLRLVGIGG